MKLEELKARLSKELAGCKGRASLFLEIEGEIIEFNSHLVYQSASLIKLPILLEGLRQIETGKLQKDRPVTIREIDKTGDTGVLQAMKVPHLPLEDLLALMIIVSDNSATNLLIDLIGINSINSTIAMIGMNNSKLERKMLDFDAIRLGKDNFTSASDIALCLKEAVAGRSLNEYSRHMFYSFLLQQQFKEKLPFYMDNALLKIGNKTGELPGVEHDCGIITYGKKHALIVVLIDGLSEPESGNSTIRQIGKHLNRFISGISTEVDPV
ncbi:serine hydrolase [Mesobacillus subterraneus]|uniref:serine hydrolase n=1 Tax=Mesobacillus subterraneus TaxID=285983 RepID=UPI001CFE7EEE|nr:serine hydrolase [Mesobacillus subterraneus]WLR57046.1 serine hydrolase [Mesobacillus subterraneus]